MSGAPSPASLDIVLGDFNKGNLTHELHNYKQFIKCPARERNILDHCNTTANKAYAIPNAVLGHSHIAYRQKLMLCKRVVRKSKKMNSKAIGNLRACVDCTEWNVSWTAINSLWHQISASVSTAVCHHAPSWVFPSPLPLWLAILGETKRQSWVFPSWGLVFSIQNKNNLKLPFKLLRTDSMSTITAGSAEMYAGKCTVY